MAFRKLYSEKIFDGYSFVKDHVLVLNEDGSIEDLIPFSEAGSDIENFNGIISPGFINAHCHLELSHMKGRITEHTGLVDFVMAVVGERHSPEEEILAAIAQAEDEMWQNGIEAVGDICNNGTTIEQKRKGRIQYYNFIEASGWQPSIHRARYERVVEVYEKFLSALPSNPISIVPHASYSVSSDLWKLIRPFYAGKTLSIHNQESKGENDLFLTGKSELNRMFDLMKIKNDHHLPSGKSSLQTYYSSLSGAGKIILVHNSFTSAEDIDYVMSGMQGNHTSFCICINANQYIENAVPPIDLLVKKECNIVLGTDSLASNHSLNIMDEIKTIKKFFPPLELEKILGWATINGARALSMDDQLGSFEKGKKPGVVLISENFKAERIT
jgi:aminodeoxyfutalosine deaminase